MPDPVSPDDLNPAAQGCDAPTDNGFDPPLRMPRRGPPSATQRALGLLTRREHSRRELTRKLTARGLDADEVEAAVARLAGDGWQDDTRFAQSLMRARVSGGYGPLRIRAELATHGLDRDLIAATLDGFHGDWAEAAADLVRRRYGPVAALDPPRRRKAADFLVRRGFELAAVRAVLRLDPELG